MIKKSYYKDVFRAVIHTISRFISIFLIVALGAGFYAGLNATAPDMRLTIDKYYKENNMMDMRLLSTMGFTEGDIEQIKKNDSIKGIMPAYSADVICSVNASEKNIRIHTIPNDGDNKGNDYINRPIVKEGRMPNAKGECVINGDKVQLSNIQIGTKIKVLEISDSAKDSLETKEFEVVGFVESPYYISYSMETTAIGNGKLNNFLYVTEDNFQSQYYTEVFLTFNNTIDLPVTSNKYKDKISEHKELLKTVAKQAGELRVEDIYNQAKEKVDNAKKEYEDGKAKAESELKNASKKLIDADKEIARKSIELENGKKAIEQAKDDFEKKEIQVQADFEANQEKINQANKQLKEKKAILEDALAKLAQAKPQIDGILSQIEQLRAAGLEEQAQELEQSTKAFVSEYKKNNAEALKGKSEYENAVIAVDQNQMELDAGKKTAQIQLDLARGQIEQQEKSIKDGVKALENGKRQAKNGWDEYNKSKVKADEEIEEGRLQLKKAEDKLIDLPSPEWFYLGLETNTGFVSVKSDAERIGAIASVFPVIFFLVAALVALTTMTRMVEEERIIIGTYKALGYTKKRIAAKYLIYGSISSIFGSIFGIILGLYTLPAIIWNAYRMIYVAPGATMGFNWNFSVIAFVASVGITLLATAAACRSSLHENTADLMMPKAPKLGKRILLERASFIWKRLSFTYKVTCRNLFRYKKRLFMTVIGIAGCTGLLLTAFGIRDSISDIVGIQFHQIYNYDTTIEVKDDSLDREAKSILGDTDKFAQYTLMRQKNTDVTSKNSDKIVNGYSVLTPDSDMLKDFIEFRTRNGKKPVEMTKTSVVVTEKLAKELEVGIGDEITFEEAEDKKVTMKITGITENYVFHYIYIGSDLTPQVTDEAIYNQIIAKTAMYAQNKNNIDLTTQKELSKSLQDTKSIGTVSYTEDISASFNDMIKSLASVVLVLIFCAGLLAFIVLYNLTNINVRERQREIATIKVLGFYDGEVSSYIYRETFALTLIGMAVGLIVGIFMHSFVIQTAEVDIVMFGRSIAPLSFVWSGLLTIAFSVVVNLVMFTKLKKIDMVESLKSVD